QLHSRNVDHIPRRNPTLMAKAKDFPEPVRDGRIELVQFLGKKVVCAFHNHKMVFTRKRCNQGFDFSDRAILVSASVHEKLRLPASMQKRKIGARSEEHTSELQSLAYL